MIESDRHRLYVRLLELADNDARIVAAAVVGSLALGPDDQWSDLDLTFAVAEGVPVTAVREEWTARLAQEFGVSRLFDLQAGPSLYRVLLLPSCLQTDISFTPATQFGAVGPTWRLLFGTSVARPQPPLPDPEELLGYAVHHALRARICIERGRLWQAAYWLGSTRDTALSLACVRHGLPHSHGRGVDALPAAVRAPFEAAFNAAPAVAALVPALAAVISGLRQAAHDLPLLSAVEPQLERLLAPHGAFD